MSDNRSSDGRLDASTADDESYLAELGYQQELKRVLGFFSSFGMQFTAVAVAGGVFLTFGYGFSTIGPAIVIAWAVGGLLQCITAWSIAEAASAYPLAGGAYQIVNRLANVRLGWQVGWMLLMAHIAALAGEAVGLAPFVADWFGADSLSHTGTLLLGGGLIILALIINVVGVRLAAFVNNLGVSAELIAFSMVIIALVVVLLFGHHDFHAVSFLTKDAGISGGGILPFLYALLMPAFVISAFDVSGTAGEETNDAARTVPRGMVVANFSAYLFGLFGLGLLVLAITNVQGTLDSAAPMTYVLDSAIGHFLAKTFEVLAVLALFVNMVVLQLSAARIIWAQARDGQAPAQRFFTRRNVSQVPVNATIVTGVLAIVFTLWSSLLTVLLAMTAVLWAVAYGLLVLVKTVAQHQGRMPTRPWNNRGWQIIDAVAIVWSTLLAVVLIRQDWQKVGLGALAVVVIGLAIYYLTIPASRRGIVPGMNRATGDSADEGRVAAAVAAD